MSTILMSIKPEYVNKIFSGEKKYEYRKRICKNNIEKGTELMSLKKSKEEEIDKLVMQRKEIYSYRNNENEEEVREKANIINKKLNDLRKDIRICKSILSDSYKISQKYKQARILIHQADMEMKKSLQRKKGR